MAAIGILVAALWHAFPEALRTDQDRMEVGLRASILALVAASILRRGQLRRAHLKYAALWTLVIAVLALGFAYRDELGGVGQHLRLAFNHGDPVVTASHELIVPQAEDGSYLLVGKVNGQRVAFTVDTGSSDTVLSPDDARRIGVDVGALRYVMSSETANGVGYGAPLVADQVQVGPIAVKNMAVLVNKAPMSTSLLGMSFLSRLQSFRIEDHRLVLRWRDAA